jgi:hypothetical protein
MDEPITSDGRRRGDIALYPPSVRSSPSTYHEAYKMGARYYLPRTWYVAAKMILFKE